MSESADFDFSTGEEDLKSDLNIQEIDYTEESGPEDDIETRVILANEKNPYIKWDDDTNKSLRLLIKSDILPECFKLHYISYLRSLKERLPFLLRDPKYCRLVAKKMSRTLFLFKSLYNNTSEIDLYNIKMCELLSILTILELRHASNFDELKIEIVKRLCMNFDIHLRNLDITHILRVFLYLYLYYFCNAKTNRCYTIFDQTEVLTKIFEKYLKKFSNITQTKLNDKLYCMYILAFCFWIHIENNVYEKNNIARYANQAIAPKPSLKQNSCYSSFFPEYQNDQQNITKFILDKKFNEIGLLKVLIQEDSYEDMIINLCAEPEQQIIDLDDDENMAERNCENLTITDEIHIEPIREHSTVAIAGLTEEKENEETTKCLQLNKLIRLARQARKLHLHPSNTASAEIISLMSDDENEIEEEENEGNEQQKETEINCDEQINTEEHITEQNKNIENCNLENLVGCEANLDKPGNEKSVVQENCDQPQVTKLLEERNNSIEKCKDTRVFDANIDHQETQTFVLETERKTNLEKEGSQERTTQQKKINMAATSTQEDQRDDDQRVEDQRDEDYAESARVDATTQESIRNKIIEEDNVTEDKEENYSPETNLEKSIISSSNKSTDNTWSEFVPIFDENLSFVTDYVTKTYSSKKNDENSKNNLNVIEEYEKNDNEEDNEQSEAITSNHNYIEVTSSTLNNECENGNFEKTVSPPEQRVADSNKIVHQFFTQKKVNFAPLPEKHMSKNHGAFTTRKRVRANSMCIERIKKSFSPTSTDSYNMYETHKDRCPVKGPLKNSYNHQTSNNTQKSYVAGSTENAIQIPDIRSASPFINFGVSSPNKTKGVSESRPTAEGLLVATSHKLQGNGNISGTSYNSNQHSPNKFKDIDRFTSPPNRLKPNFYDYSSTNRNTSVINLKHISDFDLYLFKLRKSKKEADKQLKKEQRMIKQQKLVEKTLHKNFNFTFNNENKLENKKSIPNNILFSLKEVRIQLKRINVSSFMETEKSKDGNFNEENSHTSVISDEKSKSILIPNKQIKEKLLQIEDDILKDSNNLSKQNIINLHKNNVKKRGRKRIRNSKLDSPKVLQQNNISEISIENNNNYNNPNISYETLRNIVEKVTNSNKNNEKNNPEGSKNSSQSKRKINAPQPVIKIKRLKVPKSPPKVAAHDKPEEDVIVQCSNENINLSNISFGISQELNVGIEKELVLSENENSVQQENQQETNNTIDSNNENIAINNGDISLNSIPKVINKLLEFPVLEDLSNNNGSSNLIEKNINDLNIVLNQNKTNNTTTTSDKSKSSSPPPIYELSPRSDSFLMRKRYDKELESIFRIKENEVTSTQESEVSSSLDLQSPITKRRKSCKSSLQDSEIPYIKDFALDCDETASNAPTTTTIIDIVIANKKKRRRQKKFDTDISNNSNANAIEQLKAITKKRKTIIANNKNLHNKNGKNHIRKFNKINSKIARKTYSKNNIVSNVFVPPDVEEMIHKDVEAQEAPNN